MLPRREGSLVRNLVTAALLAACVTSFAPITASGQSAQFAINVGGESEDLAQSIAVDDAGNSYVTGYFTGTVDFDPGPGEAELLSGNGTTDAFVAKYDPSGELLWVFRLGGKSGDDLGIDIAVQGQYIVVVGQFSGTTDFDPGPTLRRMTAAGGTDGFVLSVSRNSGTYSWAKRIGGTGDDRAGTVSVHQTDLHVGGSFADTVDFDPGAGVVNRTAGGGMDAFILRLSVAGAFEQVRTLRTTGGSTSTVVGLDVDSNGRVLVTGWFTGTADFNPSSQSANRTANGMEDVFILRLTAAGAFSWVRTLGSADSDFGIGVVTSDAGSVFVTGAFSGTVDFEPGAGISNRTSNGGLDSFVGGYTSSGTLVFAATTGSFNEDLGIDISLDAQGRLVSTGQFFSTADFDPGGGSAALTSAGASDAYVWLLTTSGVLVDAFQLGGLVQDSGQAVATSGGDVFSVGWHEGSGDFDPDLDVLTLTSAGDSDGFLSRIDV
jgi:Beta-propeller repeat